MLCQSQIFQKIKIRNYIFYVALMLETLFVLLDKSNYIIQHETWLFRFTFMLFGVKILLTNYSKREWVAIIAMGALGVISWRFTDREEVIRIAALIIACKDIDLSKTMKLVLFETLTGCLVIVALSLTGVYGTATVTGMFRGGGIEETRYCLGMGHPNALHCMFLMLMTLTMAVYEDKMNAVGYGVALVLNYGMYKLTDSRTSMLIGIAAVALAVFMHYAVKWRDKKIIYQLGIAFIIIGTTFSVWIAKVGVSIPILRQIDIRINGRFQWARSDGGIEFWSLFSNEANQNYFDMAYVRLFYWYGIIPAIIFLIAVCITIWRCRQEKAYGAFLLIMVLAAYSMIEAHAVSVYIGRNYALIYMGALLFKDRVNKQSCSSKEQKVYEPDN